MPARACAHTHTDARTHARSHTYYAKPPPGLHSTLTKPLKAVEAKFAKKQLLMVYNETSLPQWLPLVAYSAYCVLRVGFAEPNSLRADPPGMDVGLGMSL